MFKFIMLFIAITLAGNVAYASVYGFIAIFAATPIFAISMGVTIECGKLAGISYLYRYGNETTTLHKYTLLLTIVVTIFLSAVGVFGFLSRAHLENSNPIQDNSARLEYIAEELKRHEGDISYSRSEIEDMNAEISKLIEYAKVSGENGSRATRLAQTEPRKVLNDAVKVSQNEIVKLRAEKFELEKEVNSYSVEVGPIRYVAELFWDTTDENNIDKAVRLLIILIMFVFDPLAILLLIAANKLYMKEDDSPPDDSTDSDDTAEKEFSDEQIDTFNNVMADIEARRDEQTAPDTSKEREPSFRDSFSDIDWDSNKVPETEVVEKVEEVSDDQISDENPNQEIDDNKKAIEDIQAKDEEDRKTLNKLVDVVGGLSDNITLQMSEREKREQIVKDIRAGN